jgi:hypothetical protein
MKSLAQTAILDALPHQFQIRNKAKQHNMDPHKKKSPQ